MTWAQGRHIFFLILFIYSWETHRDRDTGRGRSRLHAGSLMWDLIPGLQDYTLGQRLNRWVTQVSPQDRHLTGWATQGPDISLLMAVKTNMTLNFQWPWMFMVSPWEGAWVIGQEQRKLNGQGWEEIWKWSFKENTNQEWVTSLRGESSFRPVIFEK